MNNALDQFGDIYPKGSYKTGTIQEVNTITKVYLVETSSGLQLSIQDDSVDYLVDDMVILSTSGKQINDTFILKKVGKNAQLATNIFINLGED